MGFWLPGSLISSNDHSSFLTLQYTELTLSKDITTLVFMLNSIVYIQQPLSSTSVPAFINHVWWHEPPSQSRWPDCSYISLSRSQDIDYTRACTILQQRCEPSPDSCYTECFRPHHSTYPQKHNKFHHANWVSRTPKSDCVLLLLTTSHKGNTETS